MGATTKIGWCDHTMNFWWGCEKVATECRFCYIAGIMKRAGIHNPFEGPIRTMNWCGPDKWNKLAALEGTRHRVFTCSMSDFFHKDADPWRTEAWEVIRRCQHLDWLILTKRPERIREQLPQDWGHGYPNVWLGVSCGHSSSYRFLRYLEAVPAKVRFVSAEPLLEEISFREHLHWLDWVITGCEQAGVGKRRPMNLDWVRAIDAECREFGKAHFFKQYYFEGGRPTTDGILDGKKIQEWPDSYKTNIEMDEAVGVGC